MAASEIAGQLNAEERRILAAAVTEAPVVPRILLEVGTWLGGGSTLCFLRAMEERGAGHLWGIEANPDIYEQMLANLRRAAPEALHRFTPLFGFSSDVIPVFIRAQDEGMAVVDLAFLDGGDNPMEQITEFQLLDPVIPVGGQLFAHDAKLRKGKWLVPYLKALDHWQVQIHDISAEGLLAAKKISLNPSAPSRRNATRLLRRLRLAPVELLGRCLPSAVCRFLLRMVPQRIALRIGQGR